MLFNFGFVWHNLTVKDFFLTRSLKRKLSHRISPSDNIIDEKENSLK
jgi:hypothetical protein